MSEFFEAFRQQLKERVTSPLSGAFLVSWMIINYQFLTIIFSDVKPWVKFGFIKNHLFPDLLSIATWGFVAPLLAGSLYILVYPHPARWAMSYTLKQKKRTLEAKYEAEKLIPMTREEADAEIAPLINKISSLQEQLERRESINDRLKSNIERAEKSEADLLQQLQKKDLLFVELSEKQAALEADIAKRNGTIKAMGTEIEEITDRFDAYRTLKDSEIESLNDEISHLEQQLKDARQALAKAETQNYSSLSSYGAAAALSNGLALSAGVLDKSLLEKQAGLSSVSDSLSSADIAKINQSVISVDDAIREAMARSNVHHAAHGKNDKPKP